MFKELYKKMFNKNTVSEDELREINIEIYKLKQDISLREEQVKKLTVLANKKDEYQQKYLERILVHNKIILEKKAQVDKLELKAVGG